MPSLIFNPLYLLVPPALILISVPLTILAVLTSVIAFTLLTIRVSIVYFDLALALVRSPLFTESPKAAPHIRTTQYVDGVSKGRSSVHSKPNPSSVQDSRKHGPAKSESFATLLLLGGGAQGRSRDFEGVGGWRDAGEDAVEEALWLSMNSRLELPAVTVTPARQRRHQRSLTGGSIGLGQRWSGHSHYSPESIRMSPVQSRARTPSVGRKSQNMNVEGQFEEYFGFKPREIGSGLLNKKVQRKKGAVTPGAEGEECKKSGGLDKEGRRKSISGSSIASNSSGKLSRSTAKLTSDG